MSWVLVLEEDVRPPVMDVGRSLAQATRRPLADVTRSLGRCRGVIDLGLTRVQARKMADVLASRGCRARVVFADDAPEPPPPRLLADADPTDEGLLIQRIAGLEPHLLEWDDVELVAVGTVTFEARRPTLDADGAPDAAAFEFQAIASVLGTALGTARAWRHPGMAERFKATRRRKAHSETVVLLDLLRRSPRDRYRVVAGRFVYDYLGAELALSSTQNFRRLVRDIAARAPGVFFSATTVSWLDLPKSRDHRFKDPAQFDAYVRWVSAWRKAWSD